MVALISMFVSVCAWSTPPVCPGPRAESPLSASQKMLVGARGGAGDPCPDHAAEGTDEEQSQLLDEIRVKARVRFDAMITHAQNPKLGLVDKFQEMRSYLSLQGARVRVDDVTKRLIVEPGIKLEHPAKFAELDPVDDAESKRILARIAPKIEAANAKLASGRHPEAQRELRDELIDEGKRGYVRLISADPALLYVAPDGDVISGSEDAARFLTEGKQNLEKLGTRPPRGAGVGMIYLGPSAVDVISTRPELCGAFHSLLRKAGGMRRSQEILSWTVSVLDGACWLAVLRLLPACLIIAGADVAVDYIPSADFKRQRLLYGGIPPEAPAKPALTAETKTSD